MKKLTHLLATCLLILSLSAFAFAGETQGPWEPAPPPPPPGDMQGPGIVVQSPTEDPADASFDALGEATELMARWFLNIL